MSSYPVHITEIIAVVELPPRIDSVTSGTLDQDLKDLQRDHSTILCDFSGTTYISSMGLRVLLGTQKNMAKTGGHLLVCSLSSYVQEVFDISGFSRIFTVYPSEEKAVSAISGKSGAG